MNGLLEVKNLCVGLKEQPSRLIVKHVDFTLRQGKALALVGESGSGKTMTCKALMRLLNRKKFEVSGSIRYREVGLLTLKEKEMRSLCGSKIAMIVQHPMTAFNPTIKIGAQIVEAIRVHRKIGKKEAYEIGIQALEQMHLPRCEQLMNSYSYTLSGGMLQRIMIAVALIHKPEILIADEATTALDVKNQSIVLEELDQLKKKGIALLLVTHDLGVAAKLADDMVVMKSGEIIERGTVFELFASPREAYTKELLGARLMKGAGL
ncbi:MULTISPECIES: ABC transporter ATP-binding protein [Shouchella]|jgi:nickel transport system ATP-binding protein|uniref:ABC transporter ATP-binding protein n=1 Tax=Shouchella TaxID=2893057 RepID=UPI00092324BB|nr:MULTISPECIES: ABC transporter ATP-binding protein [Shouchella]MBX0321346.1 ABC transporter ATP-binding protein [Shouchella clausii]MDO7282637.1 ABC transporter ATP-binding protein [Shouchella clausii]MDO7302734.1 ABC transporter ATP-binding protein [Shouchella clausii]PAD18643.1 ABC transporter ATP-binding protein [Shouchella clausii]PAD90886.1 ABC transporter ATP-binding protein [Shouchella clausii]